MADHRACGSCRQEGSAERGEATRQLAGQPQDYPGGVAQFSHATLRAWIADFERDGLIGLLPKQRADRGQARTIITRAWDSQIDLPDDEKQRIAAEISKTARSMVANDGTSEREVRHICERRLFHHCVSTNWLSGHEGMSTLRIAWVRVIFREPVTCRGGCLWPPGPMP